MELISESVLEIVEYLDGELLVLQELYSWHPCREHFRYGRPRLHRLIVSLQENNMSTATSTTTYLSTTTTTFPVSALDQYGFPFTGDLSAVTATSGTPANVTVELSSFVDGQATLTLTQAGGEGTSDIVVTDGSVSALLSVESYVPVLTTLNIGAAVTGTPAVVATATPATTTTTTDPTTTTTTDPTAAATPAASTTNTAGSTTTTGTTPAA